MYKTILWTDWLWAHKNCIEPTNIAQWGKLSCSSLLVSVYIQYSFWLYQIISDPINFKAHLLFCVTKFLLVFILINKIDVIKSIQTYIIFFFSNMADTRDNTNQTTQRVIVLFNRNLPTRCHKTSPRAFISWIAGMALGMNRNGSSVEPFGKTIPLF